MITKYYEYIIKKIIKNFIAFYNLYVKLAIMKLTFQIKTQTLWIIIMSLSRHMETSA